MSIEVPGPVGPVDLSSPSYHLCTIQDYNSSGDTCTVSYDDIGIISSWIDGVIVATPINRAHIVAGAQGLIFLPDPHSPCIALLIMVYSAIPGQVTNTPTSTTRTEAGRGQINIGSSGSGSATVSFSPAFSNIPTVYALLDQKTAITPTSVTSSSFTVSLSGKLPGSTFYFSWTATGNQ